MAEALYIIGCTRRKIWDEKQDAPDYVPAYSAYKGRGFLRALAWIGEHEWVILSGKYGFIEPEHPISRYDVHIGHRRDNPISDKTLKAQVHQKRTWRREGKLIEVRLSDFPGVICLNCNKTYLGKVQMCFPDKKVFMKGVK